MPTRAHVTTDRAALDAWWRAAAGSAWRSHRRTVCLVPSRSFGFFLKSQLVTRGIHFAGINLWTPAECRKFLLDQLAAPATVAGRETLHLLLSTVAERDSVHPVARAVALDPSALLRAFDVTTALGDDVIGDELAPLLDDFKTTLTGAKLQTAAQADQWLAGQRLPVMLESVLIAGFTSAHWPVLPLLRAAVAAAGKATVVLGPPYDAEWCSAWGTSAPTSSARAVAPIIRVGENLREQARVIAAQTLAFLADDSCMRLVIALPGGGALAREVAAALTELEIPHNDAIGHRVAGAADDPAWHAWLDFQRQGRLEPLYELLRCWPAAAARVPSKLEDIDRAFNEVLVDDVTVIAAYLREKPLGAALSAFTRLPERAPVRELIEAAVAALTSLELTGRADMIRERAVPLAGCAELPVSRDAFLRWLDESCASRQRDRAEAGNHPYARVHLLPYAQAEGQTWSHVILAGLNEGQWPPPSQSSPFLPGELNARLDPRTLGARAVEHLLAAAEVGACLTASLRSEMEPTRHLIASEPLSRFLAGKSLESFCVRMPQSPASAPKDIEPTLRAFNARRAGQKFGEYEFALVRPPRAALSLPCKEWENALKDPGTVFLKRVLGVESSRATTEEDRWALTAGTWIHRWLRQAANPGRERALAKMPAREALVRGLRDAADATRREIAAAFDAAGRKLPGWWLAGWHEAMWKAAQLASALADLPDWPWLAAEWNLPAGVNAGGLRLHGRIDLLLAQQDRLDAGKLWVIDFKTGGSKTKLPAAKLAEGRGVQVALYALALQSLGATDVTASLARPGEPIKPGLSHADVAGATAVWETLREMQDTGVFGMFGELRPEFGAPREYPLATLPVDAEIVGEKWAATHPRLQPGEDDGE